MSSPVEAANTIASAGTLDAIADLADRSGLRRVHVFGWRDLDDDEAGGSEVHADRIEAIWARAGLEIVHRTSFASGRPVADHRNGYRVSRLGSRYLVFPRAAVAEVAGRLGPTDAVVEIWNGVPFLSPVWWHGPTAVWLHHVHGPMWQQSLPGPVAALGNVLEERVAPRFYRRVPVVTLSPSSKVELVDELGFDESHITVIPPGIDPSFSPGAGGAADRSPTPLAVAVGRLTPVKDFARTVRVVAAARQRVPDLELVIVGEGYLRDEIEAQVRAVGGGSWVHMPGRITDDELLALYRRAWLAVSCSTREGWGMTLTEAAACGTPAVATAIAGHADAVADGRSGRLGRSDDELVDAVVELTTDPGTRSRFRAGALGRAAELTWEACALANFRVLAEDAMVLRRVGGQRRRVPRHPKGRRVGR